MKPANPKDLPPHLQAQIARQLARYSTSVPVTQEAPKNCVKEKARGKGKMKRHEPGKMNQTEARFFSEHLDGKYPVVLFESLKFRLADKTFYTPDFVTVSEDGEITVWETKSGFHMEDSRVKWKVAAEQYFWLTWKWCVYKNKQWKIETYGTNAESETSA